MKGKIDNNGMLRIYRGDANPDHYQPQYCPFVEFDTTLAGLPIPRQCGCWCPHFGEPARDAGKDSRKNGVTIQGTQDITIDICHGKRLIFDQFTDERTG